MDRPFEESMLAAKAFFEEGQTVFQRFTCRGCGSRETMEEPNRFFVTGICEGCGTVTDLVKAGCGYALLVSSSH